MFSVDPEGEYIKKHLPKLKNIPTEYIHSYMLPAWLAPKEVQKEVECAMWKDYPKPVVHKGSCAALKIKPY